MAGRYFVNLLFTVIVLVIICLLNLNGVSSIFNFLVEVDAAIIVIVFPLIFMGLLNGWKNIGKAFSILSKKDADKKTLINAQIFFGNYSKSIFLTAFIAFIIALTQIPTMGDISVLWPNLSMALIMPLYAGILYIVIVMPYRIAIKRKLMETEE